MDAMNQRGNHRVGRHVRPLPGLPGDLHAGDRLVAFDGRHLAGGDQPDAQLTYPFDGAGVRPECLPAVDQGDALGDRVQRQRPVEG